MILGSKNATRIHAAILLLNDSIQQNTRAVEALISKQDGSLKLLERLSRANEEFTHVIENFFAVEKKIHIEEAKRREKRELELHPTDADNRY